MRMRERTRIDRAAERVADASGSETAVEKMELGVQSPTAELSTAVP